MEAHGDVWEFFRVRDINPIQTRGGRILPARTLDIYNFF